MPQTHKLEKEKSLHLQGISDIPKAEKTRNIYFLPNSSLG